MNTKRSYLALALLLTTAAFSYAADVKSVIADKNGSLAELNIRVIDAFEVMQHSKAGQQLALDLQETNKQWTQEIAERGQKLEKELKEYEAKKATLSESAREKEEKRLTKAHRDHQLFVEEKKQDFQTKQAKATEQMFKEMKDSAAAVAKAEHVDLIVDKATGQVLYNSPKADLTNKLVADLDKKHDVKVAQQKTTKPATAVADASKGTKTA